jgi:hypothetical protein
MQQLSINKMADTFLQDERFSFGIDTLHLARKSIQANWTAGIPVAYNLAELHQHITGHLPTVSHCAIADVRATITILFYNFFGENRGKCLNLSCQSCQLRRLVQPLRKEVILMTLTPVLVITPKHSIQWRQQMMTTTILLQLETSGLGGKL